MNESVVEACGRCVYLGNTRSLGEDELRQEVGRLFGPLDAVDVVRDRAAGGLPRGYAFATFRHLADARACVRAGYFFVGACLVRSHPADRPAAPRAKRDPADPAAAGEGGGPEEEGKVFLGGTGTLSREDLLPALEAYGEVRRQQQRRRRQRRRWRRREWVGLYAVVCAACAARCGVGRRAAGYAGRGVGGWG